MEEGDESRRDELALELREQSAIYRIAVSEDGKLLADRLNAMLDECVGLMIVSDDPIYSEVMKGKARGISEVISIFAEIEEQINATEQEIEIELSDKDF